jgi:CBS domain-containing protein
MQISDVLHSKGTEVFTVRPDTLVSELIGTLVACNIGACVVSSDGRTVVGIVSERDVAIGLAAFGARVLAQPVSTIATTRVHTVSPHVGLDDVMLLMTHRRIRHVPVLVDGELAGIVSLGDIVARRLEELESERRHLMDYISSAG